MFDAPSPLDRAVLSLLPGVTGFAATFDTENPEILTLAFQALGGAWAMAYACASLVWLGTWATLRGLDVIGHDTFLPVFLFILGFCVIGMLDALWRCILAYRAKKRYLRAGRVLDARAVRQVARSRTKDGAVLLQIAGGLAVGSQLVTAGDLYAGSFALVAVVGLIQLTS